MTLQERQMYVTIIKKLYGTSIYVDESQITDEVVGIVETILKEIRNCTKSLGIFISIVQGLADALQATGEALPKEIIEDMLKDQDLEWIRNMRKNFTEAFVESFVTTWINILTGAQQSTTCVNGAKLNWKSALAIALLGI
ncbi:hypothetical protein GCM10025882_26830 [Acinetobacter gyllenbergii]|uniref:Uncharacterized protein n=1 Tax=Acinetobacter gyllenbergii CIP 110306 = MTCC 11365 TaxID=1217657 RepID=A0A829HDW7_9GAMM|nr:hypothetical protein [Acinetobacter gyllenbergii]EPF70798.1 hypothetical protein F957_03932 [Acinetobacter gyllenbergii CIP 110306 = MTCC 11365]EPH35688.1 hypothetical protein L293_0279 [Acinetobacter gyllenbergii CIP 110306 = MTCC 11365]ESK56813.1 hypothetical protein F987_00304 [Acinetobacter gyllenbergii NIPH 230]OBY75288.1 hypothetical protein NG55_01020 [Acinetobacter gyllenbergii]GMA12258.1 hypothetical protein GCM10025882_26830 [Acinetobacter gyllenbergii]